jgi:hypothetical protein
MEKALLLKLLADVARDETGSNEFQFTEDQQAELLVRADGLITIDKIQRVIVKEGHVLVYAQRSVLCAIDLRRVLGLRLQEQKPRTGFARASSG